MSLRLALLPAVLMLVPFTASAGEKEDAAFESLKALVGTWRPAQPADSALRVRFALIAGDSVLTETWSAPKHASMTVYHLDGDDLLATHYCPQGNQPRLALREVSEDGTLRFTFRDGTGLDHAGEHYQHVLTLRDDGDGRLVRGEVYAEHGADVAASTPIEEREFVRLAGE